MTFVDAGTGLDITNANLGITSGAQIRLNNYYPDTRLNAVWDIVDYPGDAFQTTDNYLYFQINFVVGAATESWPTVSNTPTGNDDPTIEFSGSGSQWKEFGIIGGEALRTDTESIGDYKLGINTIAKLHMMHVRLHLFLMKQILVLTLTLLAQHLSVVDQFF